MEYISAKASLASSLGTSHDLGWQDDETKALSHIGSWEHNLFCSYARTSSPSMASGIAVLVSFILVKHCRKTCGTPDGGSKLDASVCGLVNLWRSWISGACHNFCILSSMPLYLSKEKHQKECSEPTSIMQSLRWQCICMLGVHTHLSHTRSEKFQQ